MPIVQCPSLALQACGKRLPRHRWYSRRRLIQRWSMKWWRSARSLIILDPLLVKIRPSTRQLVRQDGWQAAIFGGCNQPSLPMVAHQLASASEVTSS